MGNKPGVLMGELVRQRRKEKGLTMAQLAEASGSHPSSIAEVEGQRRPLGDHLREKLEKVLGPLGVKNGRYAPPRGVYVGTSLKAALAKLHLSQKELSKQSKVHFTSISALTRNTARAGSKTLAKLERVTGPLTEDENVTGTTTNNPQRSFDPQQSFTIRKKAVVDLTPDPDEGVLRLTKQDLKILMDLAWQLSNRNK